MTKLTPADVVTYISAVIGVASLIAAALPQGKPGTVWANVRVVIDTLAANFGNAANARK
jgi:hypothetical protein